MSPTSREKSSGAPLRLIRLLASMPVAIALLSLVALTSMIGTVLVQNRTPDFYMANLGPTWYRLFEALDFFDMYSSWWFITILTLLVLSVTAALVRHGPRFWRQSHKLQKYRPWPVKNDAAFTLPATLGEEELQQRLARHGFREFLHHEADGEATLLARKGRWSKLGFFLVHGSVVLICIGGLVTSQLGFRGMMNIPEGDNQYIVYVPDGNDFRRLQLPFQVRNDDFEISFYDTGMPSDYSSQLTLHHDGQTLVNKRITVNDPLRYQGITFYQSSFGDAGSGVQFVLRDLTRPEFPRQEIDTSVGKILEDGMGLRLEITELRQHNVVNMSEEPGKEKLQDIGPSLDIALQSPTSGNISYRVYLAYPHMIAFSHMGDEELTYANLGFNPADDTMSGLFSAYMKFLTAAMEPGQEAGPELRKAAFGQALEEMNIPTSRAAELGTQIINAENVLKSHRLPVLFSFTGFNPKMYTGLQVARDPGAPLIWIGSALLVLGLYMMLYFHEVRLWLRRRPGCDELEVCALLSGKNKQPLQPLLDKLQQELTPQGTVQTREVTP